MFTDMTKENNYHNISPDIEQLRNKWRRLSIEAPAPGPRPGGDRPLHHSEKQRIIRRLRALAVAGCLFMLYFVLLIRNYPTPLWLTLTYELFMAIAVCVNIYMLRMLRRTDLGEMTTVEAIAFIKRFTRLRMRFKFILTSLAVPLVALIIWALDDGTDSGVIFGAITGALLGAIVGFSIDRRFKRDLKAMRKILGEE